MKATEKKLINQDETVREIKRIAHEHFRDLEKFKIWDFFKFYNLVKYILKRIEYYPLTNHSFI